MDLGLDDVEIYLVDNISTAHALLQWIKDIPEDTVLGFDTETHGLDIYADHAKLRMVQIGDMKTGWAIPWERWGGVAIEILDWWRNRNRRFTAHNLSFDYKVMLQLADYRLPWELFDDTMLMAQIDSPGGLAGLKPMTDRHIDPRASAGQDALKKAFKVHGWDWATVPVDYPDYWYYSALDPVLASQLHYHFRYIPESYGKVYDLEYSVRRVCTEMEHLGMRIDLDYVDEKHKELGEKVESSKLWAEENWDLNIASSDQLVEFYKKLGANFSVFTPGGKPSVNKEQLDLFMKSDSEHVVSATEFILEIRKLEKLNSSYFENFKIMHDNSILHPEIKTLQARTGRMSVTNPALQTLPSGDSLIRGAFLPREEGHTLVSCDYSQVEMRLLTHFSGDEALTEAFKTADATGSDFFTEMGRMVFNDPSMDKEDKRRKLIKTLVYGMIYGASVKKSAQTVKVPLEEMQEISDAVHKRFPGINDFMKQTILVGEQRYRDTGIPYIELDSGRKLPSEHGREYSLVNYTLQGTAAELMKLAILRLDAAGLTPYMQIPIHDELIFSIPDELVDYYFPIIEECMSYASGEFSVDLLAEPERLGKRWGDGDKYA